jgi:metal-responsive CopG/Arc/MetJ family transcriptional regulator
VAEPTTQLLIHLPDALARRFKRRIAVRQRSKFIERLLEDALPAEEVADDDPLYRTALAVEQDERLTSEMAEWEEATSADGFDSDGRRGKPAT